MLPFCRDSYGIWSGLVKLEEKDVVELVIAIAKKQQTCPLYN